MYKNINYPQGKFKYFIRGRLIGLIGFAVGICNLFGYWPKWELSFLLWYDFYSKSARKARNK